MAERRMLSSVCDAKVATDLFKSTKHSHQQPYALNMFGQGFVRDNTLARTSSLDVEIKELDEETTGDQ